MQIKIVDINGVIIDKVPFGDGTTDNKQYISNDYKGYIADDIYHPLMIDVAIQYGAKPICKILTHNMSISIYKILNTFGAVLDTKIGEWHMRGMFINTISPEGICKYFYDKKHKISIETKGLNIYKIAQDLDLITKKCRYCKKEFIPNSPAQDVCKDAACQRKRLNEKQKKYQKKKRNSLT
jgi:hypothetical protein